MNHMKYQLSRRLTLCICFSSLLSVGRNDQNYGEYRTEGSGKFCEWNCLNSKERRNPFLIYQIQSDVLFITHSIYDNVRVIIRSLFNFGVIYLMLNWIIEHAVHQPGNYLINYNCSHIWWKFSLKYRVFGVSVCLCVCKRSNWKVIRNSLSML